TSSSASSTSSADTLVSQQQQHSTNPNKRPHRAMDRTQQQQHQQQHPQRQHQQTESVSSSSTAVDFTNMPFGGVPSMPLIMAEALAREGFTEYAEVLAFKQDQRQLEQVTVQSALEHQQYASSSSSYSPQEHQNQRRQQQQHQQLQQQQQQQTLQDDSYLFNFVVQEHNMIMAQHGYNNTNNGSSSSSSTAPYPAAMQGASDAAVDLQDPNNPYSFMGDMPLLEVMQYNSLLLDNNYIDDLPTSIIQGGCGADGPGMDPTSWCDSPQAFGFGGNYIGDQFSQQINIQQLPQQSQLQQQQQQSFQQGGGYFDPSASSSSSSAGSSSSSSSSSSSASSSSSGPGYGFGLPIWSAMQSGLLYPQGDFLLERKREGAAGLGHDLLQVPNGAVFAPPGARVQPPLEPAEEDDSDDDDDDDAEEYGEMEDDSPPGMIMDHQSHHHHQQQQQQQHYQQQQQQLPYGAAFPGGYLPGDESHVPPLSMPGSRSSHRLSGTKHDREEEHNTMGMNNGLMKRSKSDAATSSVAAAAAAAAAARRASAASSHSHSRNSSMSSIHSHSPKMESPSSSFSGSPSSSYQNSNSHQQKAPRPPMETIEKRMHPCTFEGCTKSFTRAFNLRSHLNTHNGERPHRCPEPGCEWDFVRRHDLDRHVKSKHMANKPYACRQCTSRFGRSDALQRHRRLENHI
ncbi:hypothetical protein BGZ99_002604, partial [Dissophora globulifera]